MTVHPKKKFSTKIPPVLEVLNVNEQHRLFYFIFEEKVAYDMQEGYRTDKIPTAAKLFEAFAAESSTDVEMGGIEPPCNKDSKRNLRSVVTLDVGCMRIE